jgi:hypothetical protein
MAGQSKEMATYRLLFEQYKIIYISGPLFALSHKWKVSTRYVKTFYFISFRFRVPTQNNVITLEPQLDPQVPGLYAYNDIENYLPLKVPCHQKLSSLLQ